MKVFNTILGVFAILGAIYCLWFPGVSFLKAGWIVTILLCVWGACALFEVLSRKTTGKDGKWIAVGGILALLAGVAAAVVSLVAVFKPGLSAILDLTVIYIFVFWLMTSGISSIAAATSVGRKAGGSKWVLSLVLGILTLIAGFYGLFHVIVMAQTIGLLIGVLLIVYGVRLFGSVFE